MRILVTGASGFIGSHFLANRKGKDNVVALARDTISFPNGTDIVCGPLDLAKIEEWPNWPQEIEGVVHLAALNPDRDDPRRNDLFAMRRANVEATAAIARRAAAAGVRRIVFLSSANVHGAVTRQAISESTLIAPLDAYARSKHEAEAAFWESLEGSETEGCVLRPAPVFGARGRGNIASLFRLAQRHVPLPLKGLGAAKSLLSVESLIEIIRLALESPAAAGESFLAADDGPLTLAEIVGAIRRGFNRPELIFPAPVGLLGAAVKMTGKGMLWETITRSVVLDTQKLKTALPWRPSGDTARKLENLAASGKLHPPSASNERRK